jgi:tetraacyldisaccharide 4'-kinase
VARSAPTLEAVWYGDGAASRWSRAGLAPAAWLYGAAVRVRNALYDRGVLRAREARAPVISIGNLTVGGTGKTPVAAWVAAELRRRGASPAIVLRGYGADEPVVHRTLNPTVPVLVSPNRSAGILAAIDSGADIVVLDDAFQHRSAARREDWVLVSAERWTGRARLLPAGAWREPLSALDRATMVLVTRKSASPEVASSVAAALRRRLPGSDVAVVAFGLRALHGVGEARGADLPISRLRAARVCAVAGVGDPGAFASQLTAAGAEHVDLQSFADHHAYTPADVARLVRAGDRADLLVCTLKDAVKLAALWPRAALPIWYVSQTVELERGGEIAARRLDGLLPLRPDHPSAALPGGP